MADFPADVWLLEGISNKNWDWTAWPYLFTIFHISYRFPYLSIFQGSSLQLQPSSQGPGPTLGSARHMPAFSLAFRSAKWKLFLKGDPRKDMVDHGPKRDVNVGYSLVNIQKTMEKHQHFSWVYQRTKWPCSIAMLVYQRVLLLYKPNEYDRW